MRLWMQIKSKQLLLIHRNKHNMRVMNIKTHGMWFNQAVKTRFTIYIYKKQTNIGFHLKIFLWNSRLTVWNDHVLHLQSASTWKKKALEINQQLAWKKHVTLTLSVSVQREILHQEVAPLQTGSLIKASCASDRQEDEMFSDFTAVFTRTRFEFCGVSTVRLRDTRLSLSLKTDLPAAQTQVHQTEINTKGHVYPAAP